MLQQLKFTKVISKLCMNLKICSSVKNLQFFSTKKLESGYITVNKNRVYYEKKGKEKDLIMLLPGALGSTQTDFNPQIEQLSNEFTVYAWDPPGYGRSRPPSRPWPAKYFNKDAETCMALMSELEPNKKWNLLGWSDGGITAIIIAGNHPEFAEKLVVWGANAYITIQDIECYEKIRDINRWSDRMRKPFEKLYGEEYFKEQWGNFIDAISRYYEENNGDICKEAVSKISCPTLILHGGKDPMVPIEHPNYLKDNIKNSEYHEFSEGKHNIHLKYATEFNKIVKEFLKKPIENKFKTETLKDLLQNE